MEKLTKTFFQKSALEVAPLLLGKLLCRNVNGEIIKYRITDLEVYYGSCDTACHAHKGKTPRNKVMFESGGVCYVYLCYGIHYLFNIVTGPKDHPEGIMIRGIEGVDGPGRVTKALKIDKSLYGVSIESDLVWVEDDGFKAEYTTAPRIGIDYATEEDINKPWRFIVK